MTATVDRPTEADVLTLIERGVTIDDIEEQTNWDADDISGLAQSNGFIFDVSTFRFRDRMAAPQPQSTKPQPPAARPATTTVRPTTRDLVEEGKASSVAAVRRAAERADAALAQLRVLVEANREKEAAAAEVRALEARLAEARAKLKGATPAVVERSAGGDAAAVRAWARQNDVACPARGRIPTSVREQYEAAVGGET